MTITDIAWSLLFMVIFLPLMTGCIVGLFVLGGADVSSPPNGVVKLFSAAAILASIALSWLLSLFLFGLLTRRFLSEESYERWQQQFGSARSGAVRNTSLAKWFFRMVKPKQMDNS